MDDHVVQIQILYRFCSRRLLFMIGIIASLILVFQTLTLPYMINSSSVLTNLEKKEILSGGATSLEINTLDMLSLKDSKQYSTYPKELMKAVEPAEVNNASVRTTLDLRDIHLGLVSSKDAPLENFTDLLEEDFDLNREVLLGLEVRENTNNVEGKSTWSIPQENTVEQKEVSSTKPAKEIGDDFAFSSQNTTNTFFGSKGVFHDEVIAPQEASFSGYNGSMLLALANNSSTYATESSTLVASSLETNAAIPNSTEHKLLLTRIANNTTLPIFSSPSFPTSDPKYPNIHLRKKKSGRPPLSVPEMRQLLIEYHSSNHQKWNSARDKQLLSAKGLLHKVIVVNNDEELYGPAFLNISKFKGSYELMEHTLKIYIYKEGNKPVFHQPLLRGIYASEGWLMKLLQTDKHFVVRDHRKAHMFYIPFSSRLLQLSLYVPGSHSHRNLAQHLKNYVDLISSKYPYWNRSGGADHFVAACHDWAPDITSSAMQPTIRALCNADLKKNFQLGKDVSLPEIYIRSARNPLRDLGGNSAANRSTLAFYAGNLHGRLRPILLQHWENKDPDMKILGPMPPGVESKMTYIHHMKNSKYCICPRGYEVNSPRVVESIYYECVPVIISDNYVPPFVEVLNWEAFSVIIPEEDVPRLKEVLGSISEEKYRLLQLGVRKVQKHFLWHNKPVKYDLFHMMLHSIWYNRVRLAGVP